MTKFFGLADIISGLLFVGGFYHLDIPRGMLIVFGAYLILKGLVFFMNFFSLIDIGAGVLLASGLVFSMHPFILVGLAVFLAVKGVVSVFTFG